jgi:hypothetical protein
MSEKALELKKMLNALDPERLTKEDFVNSFQGLVNYIKKIDERNQLETEQLKQMLLGFTDKLKSDTGSDVSSLKKEVQKAVAEAVGNISETDKRMSARLATVKDGQNADPEQVITEVLERIQLPEAKETLLDTPEDIRNKLELLQDEERLDVSAIKGIAERFGKLEDRVGKLGNTAVVAAGRGAVKAYDLSASLDGVTTTFALPAFWRVISVDLSSFPNTLRPTVDYTTNGSTMQITFTSQIDPASTLAAGQTCIIVYAEP